MRWKGSVTQVDMLKVYPFVPKYSLCVDCYLLWSLQWMQFCTLIISLNYGGGGYALWRLTVLGMSETCNFNKWMPMWTVGCRNGPDPFPRWLMQIDQKTWLWFLSVFFMAALCNRGAIIFLPCSFFLSIFYLLLFSSPNLSGRRLDVYHTLTHGVALVQI